LLQAVKSKASQLGIRINWCHVKGHQDGQMPTVLSRDAWLNIKADLLAKATVNPRYTGPTPYQLLGKDWICYINQKCIIKQLVETIHVHINGVLADKHWKQKFRLSDSTWQSIDWYRLG